MALRLRRGTDTERQLIIPENGELIYTTDTKLVYVGDGTTLGGNPISVGAALLAVVDDLSPQLGGDLDLNSFNVTGTGNIIVAGNIQANTTTVNSLSSITVAGILLNNDIDLNTNSITGTGDVDISGTVTSTDILTDNIGSNLASAVSLDSNFNLNGNSIVGIGNINIDGTITATGNIILGDETSDNVTVAGRIASDLIPTNHITYDLGSNILSWATGHFADIIAVGTITTNDLVVSKIYGDDSSIMFDNTANRLTVDTVDALVVNATQFIGDLSGSVFADDSTLFFDAINNEVYAGYGNISKLDVDSVNSSSKLLTIGAEIPTRLEIYHDTPDSALKVFTVATNSSLLSLHATRGTFDNLQSLLPGDQISGISFDGYTGTKYSRGSTILGFYDSSGVVGATRVSSTIAFINTNITGDGVELAEFSTHGILSAPVVRVGSNATATERDAHTGIIKGSILFVDDNGNGQSELQAYDGTQWNGLSDNIGVAAQATGFTFALADSYKYHRVTNAGAVSVTVPAETSVDFPVGSYITIVQSGAGQVTLAPGAGVTLNSAGGLLNTRVQYSSVTITKVAADEWDVAGDLA